MEAVQKDIQTIYKRIDEISKDVAQLKDKAHTIDLADLKREHELKVLISEAVEKGTEKSSIMICQLDEKLTTFAEKTDKRIHDLEDAENNRLAAQARQAIEDKKENRKNVVRVAITAIVTFFITILLNNFWTVIVDTFRRG